MINRREKDEEEVGAVVFLGIQHTLQTTMSTTYKYATGKNHHFHKRFSCNHTLDTSQQGTRGDTIGDNAPLLTFNHCCHLELHEAILVLKDSSFPNERSHFNLKSVGLVCTLSLVKVNTSVTRLGGVSGQLQSESRLTKRVDQRVRASASGLACPGVGSVTSEWVGVACRKKPTPVSLKELVVHTAHDPPGRAPPALQFDIINIYKIESYGKAVYRACRQGLKPCLINSPLEEGEINNPAYWSLVESIKSRYILITQSKVQHLKHSTTTTDLEVLLYPVLVGALGDNSDAPLHSMSQQNLSWCPRQPLCDLFDHRIVHEYQKEVYLYCSAEMRFTRTEALRYLRSGLLVQHLIHAKMVGLMFACPPMRVIIVRETKHWTYLPDGYVVCVVVKQHKAVLVHRCEFLILLLEPIGHKKDIITSKEDIITSKEDIITSKEDIITSKEDIITIKEDISIKPDGQTSHCLKFHELPLDASTCNRSCFVQYSAVIGRARILIMIEKLEKGVSMSNICAEYGIAKQTVADIKKAKSDILNFVLKFNVEK
uniref:HTH psq-type domain-containing protein n=1 Tax=Timema genevievae TaxID=629358 RepID=A0A7R9PGN8_TIMGE|nr:unnamed protein product [Timema genevievae]